MPTPIERRYTHGFGTATTTATTDTTAEFEALSEPGVGFGDAISPPAPRRLRFPFPDLPPGGTEGDVPGVAIDDERVVFDVPDPSELGLGTDGIGDIEDIDPTT